MRANNISCDSLILTLDHLHTFSFFGPCNFYCFISTSIFLLATVCTLLQRQTVCLRHMWSAFVLNSYKNLKKERAKKHIHWMTKHAAFNIWTYHQPHAVVIHLISQKRFNQIDIPTNYSSKSEPSWMESNKFMQMSVCIWKESEWLFINNTKIWIDRIMNVFVKRVNKTTRWIEKTTVLDRKLVYSNKEDFEKSLVHCVFLENKA